MTVPESPNSKSNYTSSLTASHAKPNARKNDAATIPNTLTSSASGIASSAISRWRAATEMGLSASDAARFQAYRTRARMGVQLWRQALTLTLLAWAALTTYVVWRQTGVFFPDLQHTYF